MKTLMNVLLGLCMGILYSYFERYTAIRIASPPARKAAKAVFIVTGLLILAITSYTTI